jgi:3-oxoacyl-[acyl-carrier-protein] synthase-3
VTERYVRIAGWGSHLPANVVRNDDLAHLVDTSDQWIQERTGIKERRVAQEGESTATLATEAGKRAMEKAGITAADLDLIIVATCTPDYANMPATASLVQQALGAPRIGAFDLNAVCSGFVYALTTGSQFVLSGSAKNVLVIGAETFTRILDWTDRSTCVLFGDGAGAVVLQPTNQPGGLKSHVLGSDGAGACNLYVPAGGSLKPTSAETVANREHYVRMNGKEVFRFATTIVPESVTQALAKSGMKTDEIDVLIPHQANTRIIDAAVKRLGIDPAKAVSNVDRFGNTSAASVPLALCEALDDGRIKSGDNVVMVGFGAGLTWGAAVWQWH